MGHLHRLYARAAPQIWSTETRLLHAFGRAQPPVAVQWLVTSACDLHCPHCYSGAGRRTAGELDTEEAKRLLIDELVALGRPTLVLAGGELLLRRDIAELIEYACARGLSYAIHTHGGHVQRFRELFARHPPVLAAISVDGDRSLHDGFRGKAGSFDAALAAIRVLRDAGCEEIVAGTTVTRDNADRLVDLFPLVAESGAHTWGLHLFAPEGRGAEHHELLPTQAQLQRVVELARRRRRTMHVELCNEWGSAGSDDVYLRDQPFACGAGRISCVVSPGGEVLPCTTTDLSESAGNLRARPLRAIWADGFAQFRGPSDDDAVHVRECWLQTRNGVRTREQAFGPTLDAPPVPLSRLPMRWLERRARPRSHSVASVPARHAARWAALGLAFVEACTQKIVEPPRPHQSEPPRPDPVDGDARPSADDQAQAERVVLAAAAATASELPSELELEAGLRRHFELQLGAPQRWRTCMRALLDAESSGAWAPVVTLAQQLADSPRANASLGEALRRHAEQRAKGSPPELADLIGLLNAAETVPVFDAGLASHLWRTSRDVKLADDAARLQRAVLYARLHRHLRASDAITRALAVTGPVEFTPWRSKAMRPEDDKVAFPDGLPAAVRDAWRDRDDAGPWDRVAVDLAVSGDAELIRAGAIVQLRAGTRTRLARLDLLRARAEAVTLQTGHGEVTLAAGEVVALHELPARLPEARLRELADVVERAASNDPVAEAAVGAGLPWFVPAIRARLRARPDDPGSPKLRTWLVVFDE